MAIPTPRIRTASATAQARRLHAAVDTVREDLWARLADLAKSAAPAMVEHNGEITVRELLGPRATILDLIIALDGVYPRLLPPTALAGSNGSVENTPAP